MRLAWKRQWYAVISQNYTVTMKCIYNPNVTVAPHCRFTCRFTCVLCESASTASHVSVLNDQLLTQQLILLNIPILTRERGPLTLHRVNLHHYLPARRLGDNS